MLKKRRGRPIKVKTEREVLIDNIIRYREKVHQDVDGEYKDHLEGLHTATLQGMFDHWTLIFNRSKLSKL